MYSTDISVVVSAYNAEKSIEKCVVSVLSQTFPVKELIIYDDASTDKTFYILENMFAANGESIHLLTSKVNRGPGGGKMYASESAKGEYILFLDADDYLDADYIEQIVKDIVSHADADMSEIDVVFTGFRQVDTKGGVQYVRKFDSAESALYGAVSNWGKLWRKGFIRENGIVIPSGRVLEDVLTRAVVVGCCPKTYLCRNCVGYNYMANPLSVSHTYMKRFLPGVAELEMNYLNDNFSKIKKEKAEEYIYWVYKIYCWHILKSGSGIGWEHMKNEFTRMHASLEQYFPEYRKNKYLMGREKLPDRLVVKAAVIGMFRLERFHFQKAFLFIYSAVNLQKFWPRM